ncbi:amino acid adenylation domain-containing protein [Wukongibacter sp. M2B1]|uniref:amino acid adenylation domain-containing protein n=1 Tax=Wukongibacter sp. M2B1 TaxID=3088895 RepID=UPI003D78D92C
MRNRTRKYPPISVAVDKAYFPTSYQQERLWYLSLLQPDSTIWNLVSCKRIKGRIDIEILKQSIEELINRQIVLRTRMKMVDGSPVQYFSDLDDKMINYISLSHMDKEESETEAIKILNNEGSTPINVDGGRLFYTTLVVLDEDTYMIIFKLHHIISDAASFQIMWRELKQIYNNYFTLKSNKPLVKLEYDYKDYSVWQNQIFSEENTKEQEKYWLNEFKDGIPILELPTNYPSPINVSFNGALERKTLPKDLSERLQSLCFEKMVLMFSLFLSAYYILLQKITHQEDMVVGTVFSGRQYSSKIQNIVGFFVNTVAIRMNVDEKLSFETFLNMVQEKIEDTYYMQDYPLQRLIHKLNPDRRNNNNRNPLFRVMINMVNNYNKDSNFNGAISEEWLEPEVNSTQVDILFNVYNSNKGVDVIVEYNTDIFARETISRLIKYYIKLLQDIAYNPKINISDISLLDYIEEKQLVMDWNDTRVEYPDNKSIDELFEEIVEKSSDKVAIIYGKEKLTYGELNERANKLSRLLVAKGVESEDIVGLVTERSIDMVVGILGILKAGAAYMPIDPSYPKDRIDYMLTDSDTRIVLVQKHLKERIEYEGEIIEIGEEEKIGEEIQAASNKNKANSLAYIMYTSGSTGRPKGVMIEHRNVIRLVKNPTYIEFKEKDRILQTGAPVFDATTFEMWGALLNGLRLYLVNEDIILNAFKLERYIKENEITIMWLTSALFNQLSDENLNIFETLRYLLVGGDVLSPKHINRTRKAFKNLNLINGYGPTENTTFSVCHRITRDYDISIPIGIPINNSSAYILDKNMKVVPIGVPGELYVGGDGLARGYLNNEELTAEKFVKSPFIEGERIYKTGDLAKWLPDGTVEFLGRIDNQVKIRGFRIELGEIEVTILKHNQIKEAIVIAREDEDKSKYLCGYIVSEEEISVTEIRSFLSERLPEYMQPTYLIAMDKLPLNQNGKVDRKQLPDPKKVINTKKEWIAPENETEVRLVKLWKEILRLEIVGITDNFFEIGGHSLKATYLTSRINKEFDIDIPLREIFSHPTIKGLAQVIKSANKKVWSKIELVKNQEYYPVSASQKRMYLINQMGAEDIEYNIAVAIDIEGELDKDKMGSIFRKLVKRHESFRTSFEMVDGQPVQRIHEDVDFDIEYITGAEDELDSIIKDNIKCFDLSKAPLLRVILIKTNDKKHTLLMDMHHIICDGVSVGILYKEIEELYKGVKLKEPRVQYKDFTRWQNEYLKSEEVKKQESYWLEALSGELPVLDIITDYPRPLQQSYKGDRMSLKGNKKIGQGLKEICINSNVTMYMLLLAVYNILLSKYSGQEDIIVGTPVAGRYHSDTQNVVGMFVNTIAMRNKVDSNQKFIEFLEGVRTNTLKAFENQEYQFEELVEKLSIKRDMSRNPVFDVMFSISNVDATEIKIEGLKCKQREFEYNIAKFDLTLSAEEEEEEMNFELEYSTSLYRRDTAQRILRHYINIIDQVIKNPDIRLQDISLALDDEKKQLVMDWNDTRVEYPDNKSIDELFEEIVEKSSDKVAIIYGKEKLTYGELNERANKLSRLLAAKGVESEDIVGLVTERSIDMVVGILGILKAGAAYMPIDPSYPKDRIDYMLTDSDTRIVLVQKHLKERIEYEGEIIEIGEEEKIGEEIQAASNKNKANSLAYIMYTSGSTGRPKGVMIEHRNVIRLVKNPTYIEFKEKDRILQTGAPVFDATTFEMWGALLNGLRLYLINEDIILNAFKLERYIKENEITIMWLTSALFNQLSDENLNIFEPLRYLLVGGDVLSPKHINRTRKAFKNLTLINAYGPTENATISLCHRITKDYDISIPIGIPINNSSAYILDKNMKVVPIGVPGELYVGGDGLARGYLNNEELTAEKFVKSPFIEGERIYKTGDLAKWLPDGTVEFLGRIDNQVKIRGFRIELGEIENKIMKYKDIKEAVVIAKEGVQGSKSLYGYVSANQEIDIKALKEYLARDLPDYMIPSSIIQLEQIPLTSNGKVDRTKLYDSKNHIISIDEYVAPKTELEKRLVNIIENILGISNLGLNDNFFSKGGNSILMVQLISALEEEFGETPPVVSIMRSNSIADIAKEVELSQEVS